jgi:trimeric autotransporter adhesin
MEKQYTRRYAGLPRSIGIFILAFLLSTSAFRVKAQQNVPVTGYNSDQVADGIGAPSTTTSASTDNGVDGGNYVFVDGTYQYNGTCALPTIGVLPAGNQISSTAVPGLTYTLQPYTANNALRIPATASGSGTGTLTLTTPVTAGALYLLSVAGGGAISSGLNITVTFTDLTTQVFSGRSAEDWCNTTSNAGYTKITTTQYNRVQAISTSTCALGGTCQYFAEMALVIDPANHAKQVASITINKTTTNGTVMNVYAVGMVPPCVAPVAQPTGLISTTLSTGYISASFTAASPAASGYLVVRYPQGATPTAPASGTTYTAGQALGLGTVIQASSATSFTSNNLTPNTSYDFYVYSYFGPCSPTASSPTYLTSSPLTSTFVTNACGGTISGVITVGPGGTYPNLTAAIAAIGGSGLSASTILELLPGYDATTETYPIAFQGDPCATSSKSITIRPSSLNISPLTITSSSAVATIDLNGAKYITFDGRPGGNGTAKMLSIINTNNSGVAIRFSNDAISNTIQYCDVQGQNTSATTGSGSAQVGVISFGTANASSLNGNDSNVIMYCDIHATSGGFPAIGIASYGNNATTPASAWNDYNVIDHCNIFDFFSATVASSAIKADGGSNRFTVSNNHVYQTASRTYSTGNNHRAFWLTPTASGASGFIVTNNFIGGSDSLGGGTYTMFGGAVATNYYAMDINHQGTVHTSVQGNIITNFSLTNSSTTGNIFRGISTGNSGHMDVGTVTGNIIGSTTVNGAIDLASNSSGATAYGILNAGTSSSTDSVKIFNNTVAGITITSPSANIGVHINGIATTTGSYTFIDNNLVGSLTNANSLFSSNPVTTAAQSVYGIFVSAGIYTSVTNNTISNLSNASVSTSTTTNTSYTRGISLTSSTTSVVTGNTIRNISTGSTSTGSNATAPLTGIAVNTSNPSTISGNTIDSLVLLSSVSTNATNVDGIFVSLNGSSPTHLVTKNFIHHIMIYRNSGATINGINIVGGSNIVANNMIQIGLKTDGTAFDNAVVIRGIHLNTTTTTTTNIFHNTVYIGGTNVANDTRNTFAFARSAASGTHQIRNNIFVNERSNATTGGKHYQIFLNNATGLSLSNNVYYGTGTGNVFGSSNNGSSDVASIISGWLSIDSNSVAGNPRFIAPNGGSAGSAQVVDLHIDPSISTPVESTGSTVTGITDDFDGNTRSALTPVDIGADAGLFTPTGMSIDSTTTQQVTAGTLIGATNQAVIAVKIYAKGAVNPLQLNALKLNTSGTTNAADILNAKVFYTAGSATFSTGTAYGSVVASPNGTFYVTGAQTLSSGLNCFWITYDVSGTATAGNVIDARLDSVGLTGNANPNILNGNPAGSRLIAAPLSGNYNVGTGQTYTTIAAALTDLGLLGVGGPVTFTLTNTTYSVATGETFPIVLGAYQGASSVNTVTFRPEIGVTASIIDSINGPMIRIDAGKYYRLDGRQGGTGTPKSLIVQNNHVAGSAVNFINDASLNMLRYAMLRGASTNTVIGVINFGPGVTTGNDSNTIEYCGIGDAGSLPTTLIQARGSYDVVTKFNSGNVIDNCEMFNFWNATGESNAFKVSKGNTDWVITNNSIFQTTNRKFPSIHYSFNWNRIVDDASNTDDAMAQASLNNMVVMNNYFGGSAPHCGGAPWTQDSSNGQFCSYFNIGNQTNSTVKGNVFTNFDVTSLAANAGSPGVWNAIQFIGGKLDIDSNIIGSVSDTGAIRITAANLAVVFPISVTGAVAGTYSMKGNKIGGMMVGGRGPNSVNLYEIFISTGSSTTIFNIDGNDIGGAANIMQASSSTSTQAHFGINNTGGGVLNITNNKIHNLINLHNAASGTAQTIGIRTTGGLNTITGNMIDSLDNTTAQTGNGANAATIGISYTSANGSSLIERNTIYGISASNATASVTATGIYYAGGTGDVLNRNMIHSILTPSSGAVLQNGIQVNGGTARVQNNMIRLGIDAAGQSQTTGLVINGLNISGGNARMFFNTVYVGGSGVSGAANTFAINRSATGTDSLYNNIIVNERQGGTGVNYAISITANTNLKANYNLYYVNLGPTLGLFNNVAQASLADWKTASGVDAGSSSGNPSFVNATGALGVMDLHITGTTPIEGSGVQITGITEDFDGDIRSSLTPTDIGADAGNFILSDIFVPAINYTLISHDTVHTSFVLNAFAAITDPSGVNVSGNIPRIYYKKTTDANVFAGNTSFDNGWKYVTAQNTTSPFDFIIDYSILNGGTVAVNDSIQYFVVAQDLLGNVGANPGAGFSAASVNSIFTAPTTPNFYRIKGGPLNGTYNIGAGQVFPHFTSLAAAIFTLNDVGVGGPVNFSLIDPLYSVANGEVFPLTINSFTGSSTTNTVTFKPAAGTTSVIAGNAAAIFKLNGADNVIIDGANTIGGTTRNLTLIDSNNTSALVWVASTGSGAGAENITVKNTNLAGNSVTSTTAFGVFSAGQAISSSGTGAHNHNLTVVNNRITNVGFGVYANGGSGTKHNTINVSNNTIGDSVNTSNTVGNVGIYMANSSGITLSGNSILNIASTYTTSGGPHGITMQSGATDAVINKNNIYRVAYTGTGGYGGKGILMNTGDANSNIEIRNNMIANIYGDGWSTLTSDAILGIGVWGSTGNVRVYFNSVTLTATSSGGTTNNLSAAFYAASGVTALTVRNNILFNPLFNSTQGASKSYAIAMDIGGTTAYTIDNNNYSVAGTTQGILGYKSGTDYNTLAAWKGATAQDAASKNVNVNFVSTADLHLTGASNGDVNLAGVPIAGITTDIDGNTRHVSYPYMGADEASTPLPVELVALTAQAKNSDVLISWVTASEKNNRGFDIERSADGKHFTKVSFVNGAGNSSRSITYSATDARAFKEAGSNTLYYRLKQVDFDGRFTYSKTVMVSNGDMREAIAPVAYPNPFGNDLSVTFSSESETSAKLELVDFGGRTVMTQEAQVKEGMNGISLNNVSHLQPGLYMLKVTLNDQVFVIKVSRQ